MPMNKKLRGKVRVASKPRNAAAPRPVIRYASRRRNAAPRGDDGTFSQRVVWPVAISSAITTGVGVVAASQKWAADKTAAVAALGGLLAAWKGEGDMVKNVGAGVLASAGSQLAMVLIDKQKPKEVVVADAAAPPKRPANAAEIPPDAVRDALERVRARMTLQQEMEEHAAA